ncbi:uncharacterized protein LOC124713868 [Schistocerca piceifrons]|uniref:uncharacterized protein LOC124713868 n=1 Tax=Schistocerca piceifrons TaxID=274613 RepID=UPI001F5F93E7|nr:uncharacterized protein LOC124713868 [Schistocerca piceifrons]
MRTIPAVLLLFLAGITAAMPTKQQGSFLAIEEPLKTALKSAEPRFNAHIIDASKTMPPVPAFRSLQAILKDIFFQPTKETSVELNGIEIISTPILNVTSCKVDLPFLNMVVEGSIGTIAIAGNYSIVSHPILRMLPAFSRGTFGVSLRSIGFKGRIGLKVDGDNLRSQNYDIEYSPVHTAVTVESDTPSESTQISTKLFDSELVTKLKSRLQSWLNRQLQSQFDAILDKFSLRELFLRDDKTVSGFRARALSLTFNANAYVDAVLEHVAALVKKMGLQKLPIPLDLQFSFSREILWITWHGSLAVDGLWIKNLVNLRRKDDISLAYEGLGVTVFGSLGIADLQVGLDHYEVDFMGLGPNGSISATIGSASASLKASVNLMSGIAPTIEKLSIDYFENVEVEITGLGILNWLVSLIASWLLGFFSDSVVTIINDQLHSLASISLSAIDATHYFY